MLYNSIQVVIVSGVHLFPFRTEKLSPTAPMVLRLWESRQPPFSGERSYPMRMTPLFVSVDGWLKVQIAQMFYGYYRCSVFRDALPSSSWTILGYFRDLQKLQKVQNIYNIQNIQNIQKIQDIYMETIELQATQGALSMVGFYTIYGIQEQLSSRIGLSIQRAMSLHKTAVEHKKVRFIWLNHRKVVILQADYYQPLE